ARRVSSGPARLGTLSYPGTVPLTTTTTGDPTGAGPVATRPAGAARPVVLGADEWAERERAHAERADAFTAGWRARKPRREKHAIEDFLFTYYPTRPAQLRRWHPGPGVVLAPPAGRADAGSPDDAPAPYATPAAPPARAPGPGGRAPPPVGPRRRPLPRRRPRPVRDARRVAVVPRDARGRDARRRRVPRRPRRHRALPARPARRHGLAAGTVR